jgi:hypothetical protein
MGCRYGEDGYIRCEHHENNGKVDFVCCDYEYGQEDVEGEIVEVDIDNIARIWLFEEQAQTAGNKGGELAARLAAFSVEGALRFISLVLTIKLLMPIL